jgi:hypothetical protein
MTKLERAQQIKLSVDRLVRLLSLNAPAIVIENERHLMAKRVADFPADEEQVSARESIAASIKDDEMKFLFANGYFDEADKAAGAA